MIKVENVKEIVIENILGADAELQNIIYVSGNQAPFLYRMLSKRSSYRGIFSDEPRFNRSRLYAFCIWKDGYWYDIQVMKASDVVF